MTARSTAQATPKAARCAPLPGIDRRLASSRRFEALVRDLSAELGDGLKPSALAQVRAAAGLQLHAERLAARMAKGEAVDPEELTKACNGAMRAMRTLRAHLPNKGRERRGSPGAEFLASLRERHAAGEAVTS